jgi:4-amino-4-deoxy-L-arabinose transferase-like glycosyltransferase
MWVLAAWACFLRIIEPHPALSTEHSALSTKDSGLSTQHSALFYWWLAALLCVAAGVLTKWTGFLFFYIMVIPMLAWHRQLWRLFHWHHLLAALIGAMLVWCWLGAVVYELGWSNVIQMLWKEGAPRVLHGQSASQHLLLETLIHPFKVLGIALPWSAIALFGLWRRDCTSAAHPVGVPTECGTSLQEPTGLSRRFLEQSLWCWAVCGTVMMSIFPDHNIRQSFSLVPAWTLLGVLALLRFLPSVSPITQKRLLISALVVWCLIKVIYVEVIIPARFVHRPQLASQAKIMQTFVPASATLYLSRVKDECLMFNYGRAVQRIASWDHLPTSGDCWCVLTESEYAHFPLKIEQEQVILDAQGEKLVLCRCRQSSQALLR